MDACISPREVSHFSERCPAEIRNNERFARGVAAKLAGVQGKEKARMTPHVAPVRLAPWLKPLRAPISRALKLQRDERCRRRKGMPIRKRSQ
jgi:hypothetical protein